jgi:type I restriction enzyme R subunit
MEGVGKVLFVVDRSDLDYQTIKEYDRFQKGAANSNTSTKILEAQLTDPNAKVIITTIQKLGVLCSRVENNSQSSTLNSQLKNERFVLIFDECHRSQFGELHRKIIKVFRKYHIFGFTGTPIFAANATASSSAVVRTTPQAFGDQLHAYTIVDAIRDGNVLPFRISTVNTVKMKEGASEKAVAAIDTEEAMMDPRRIEAVVKYISENFKQKTYGRFNSILAVSSIPAAMRYYEEFKKLSTPLKVATIFTYSANEDDVEDGHLDSGGDPSQLPEQSRDFLDKAIGDYNEMFDTNYGTSGELFQNYYRDVSLKVKTRQIDILIVVNMFLTGFDATTLNTLWVDKNLKMHGLIQAYSRTNRILDSVKKFGNIVCFRDLQDATDEAIALFGDKNARGLVLIRTFQEYFSGYTDDKGVKVKGYSELIDELTSKFPLGEAIIGEQDKKSFISLWGGILKMRNILAAFDDFEGNEILSDRDRQDYQSVYIDLYDEFRGREKIEKESITDDIEFEMELVRQVDVNIDYILMLIEKYRDEHGSDKELKGALDKAIGSSINLRSKRELIEAFIADVNAEGNIAEAWMKFVEERKKRDLSELIEKERLKVAETEKLFEGALKTGVLKTTGTDIDLILPPLSRFGNVRQVTKERVISALQALFERYKGL